MKTIDRFLLGFFTVCIFFSSCAGDDSDSGTEQSVQESVKQGDFSTFLKLFEETNSFDSWDKKVVDVAGGEGGVYFPEKVQNKTLHKHFTEIGPEFHHFIPTGSIVNLDPESSDDIPDPLTAFQFWATYKFKASSFWLLSIFALKKEWVDEGDHSEFHAHPVLLATYSQGGDRIDHFRWTVLIDDMEQINDADVDVRNDTLFRGYKPSFETETLTEIWSKTIISPEGKFRMLFKNDKETYLIE